MVRSGESVININTGPDCIYYSFTVSLFPSGCCGLAMFEHYRSKWDSFGNSLGRGSEFTHHSALCLMFIFLT